MEEHMGKYVSCRTVLLGLAVLAALVAAGSALAKAPPGDCGWDPGSQPFTNWGDSGSYFLVPDGSFEDETSGWSFSGAAVVPGNESFYVNSLSDSQSLSIPNDASATTPSVCVTVQSPSLRFFALNTGAKDSKLEVDLNYIDDKGNPRTQKLKDIRTDKTLGSWTLTDPIKFLGPINSVLDHDGKTNVSFTFSPKDSKGDWQIDDEYVDPIKSQ
jgi:hypothetical protein